MYKKVLIVLLITLIVSIGFNLSRNQVVGSDYWNGVSLVKKLSAGERQWISNRETITIGVSDSLRPLIMVDGDQAEGFLADYLSILFEDFGGRLTYREIVEKDVEESMMRGDIDCALVIPNSGMNSEIAFTLPIVPINGALYLKGGSMVQSEEELAGKKIIVVESGGIYPENLNLTKGIEFQSADSMESAFEMMETGNFDGLVGHGMAIHQAIQQGYAGDKLKPWSLSVYNKNISIASLKNSEISNIARLGVYYIDESILVPELQMKWFGLSNQLLASKPFGNIAILIFILVAGVAFIFYLFYFTNKSLYDELAERMELLRLSKNELQTTFDGVSYYMAEIDKNYRVVGINRAFEEYLKVNRRNVINTEITYLFKVGDENKQALQNSIDTTFKLEKNQSLELSIGRMILEIRFFPIKDSREKVFKILMMAIDVTDERSAKKQLIQDNKMIAIGQLAAGVAHEIRNPLGIIRNYCFLLRSQPDMEPDLKEKAIDVIEKQVERSGKIIDNLLNFSRSSNNAPEEMNLKDEILSIISFQRKNMQEKNVIVEVICKDNLIVRILAESFEIILINLIRNSIDAMPSGGTISIICSVDRDIVQMEISDTGTGIPDDYKNDIFNPFFTTKQKNEGNGLGLYLVYNEVQKINGNIRMESTIGEGTTFVVTFPRVVE
jgi:polar amino acid transport system substrate-binding protein